VKLHDTLAVFLQEFCGVPGDTFSPRYGAAAHSSSLTVPASVVLVVEHALISEPQRGRYLCFTSSTFVAFDTTFTSKFVIPRGDSIVFAAAKRRRDFNDPRTGYPTYHALNDDKGQDKVEG
jgi:hypothetical protein